MIYYRMALLEGTRILPPVNLRQPHILMGVNRINAMPLHRATLGVDPYGRPPAEIPGVMIKDVVHSYGEKGKTTPIAYEIGGDFIATTSALARTSQKNMTALAVETLSRFGLFLTKKGDLLLLDKLNPEEPILSVGEAIKRTLPGNAVRGPYYYKEFSPTLAFNIHATIQMAEDIHHNERFLRELAQVTFASLDLQDPSIVHRYVQVKYHVS